MNCGASALILYFKTICTVTNTSHKNILQFYTFQKTSCLFPNFIVILLFCKGSHRNFKQFISGKEILIKK